MDSVYYANSYSPARALRNHQACGAIQCQAGIYDDSEGCRFRHIDDVKNCDCRLQNHNIDELLKCFEIE
jgi:hypothetical protein